MSFGQRFTVYFADDTHPETDRLAAETKWPLRPDYYDYIIEDCAESYFWNNDGWERRWPRTFVLFESESGSEVARFKVQREDVPQFTAHWVKP